VTHLQRTQYAQSGDISIAYQVTGNGPLDLFVTPGTRNDIMLYAIVDAESHDAAAKTFEGRPHLQIPQASIEVMEINPLHGM
jgi:hypothetical protein